MLQQASTARPLSHRTGVGDRSDAGFAKTAPDPMTLRQTEPSSRRELTRRAPQEYGRLVRVAIGAATSPISGQEDPLRSAAEGTLSGCRRQPR
jgi:hypothetical protein